MMKYIINNGNIAAFICTAYDFYNKPFSSYLVPLFQNESVSLCKTILMKVSLISMKIKL